MTVRLDGDWEGWLQFFLRGVADTAEEATATAAAIVQMRERHRGLVSDVGAHAPQTLDHLYERPVINVAALQQSLHASWPTANKLVQQFQEKGLLQEMTGFRRNRVFRYAPYLGLFADAGPIESEAAQEADLTQGGAPREGAPGGESTSARSSPARSP